MNVNKIKSNNYYRFYLHFPTMIKGLPIRHVKNEMIPLTTSEIGIKLKITAYPKINVHFNHHSTNSIFEHVNSC